MKTFILSIFLFLTIAQGFGQTWKRIHLNEHVSISLPSIPENQMVDNKELYQIVDSKYIINVLIADLSKNLKSEINRDNLDNFYSGIINGTLAAAANPKLLTQEKIQVGKYEGREINYMKDFNELTNILVTKRIFLINKTVYICDFLDLQGEKKRIRKKLFNSIQVK